MKTEDAIAKWQAVVSGHGTLNRTDGVEAARLLIEEIERLRRIEREKSDAEAMARSERLKFENFKTYIVSDIQKVLAKY